MIGLKKLDTDLYCNIIKQAASWVSSLTCTSLTYCQTVIRMHFKLDKLNNFCNLQTSEADHCTSRLKLIKQGSNLYNNICI